MYGFFRAGARRLRESQAELNRINVFPVPDGDTGTNMAVTATKAVDNAKASESISETVGSLAEAALAGARGNSGVIFAQFLAGFREELHDTATVGMEHFVRAMEHASQSVWRVVGDPQEGTILSVIRDWSRALRRGHERAGSFKELFRAAAPSLRESLAATTNQLEALRRAGVVDAGAAGFVAFIEGAREYLESGTSHAAVSEPPNQTDVDVEDVDVEDVDVEDVDVEAVDGHFLHRYCSEFFLAAPEGGRLEREAIREALTGLGDSLIVAGSADRARVHLHTDDPALAMDNLSRVGRVLEQKVDDMRRQFEDAHARISKVAVVTDSSCDLPRAFLDAHRIHVVPLFLRFGEMEYLDRLTLDPERFYEMADMAPVFPASSQPSRNLFERLYRALLARYDRVVSIHLSTRLSGTFESAKAAAAGIDPARVAVVDSRHLSGSLGLIVLRSAEFVEREAQDGATAADTLERLLAALPEWSRKADILVSVRTLKSMVRGGRVSPLGGALAAALNVKPIISVDEHGASKLYGASLTVGANLRRIVSMTAAKHKRSPLRGYAVVHAHAESDAKILARRLEQRLGFPAAYVCEISAVVGMNAGKGALSVVTMSE
jgi:DegV family protein with EDD domain